MQFIAAYQRFTSTQVLRDYGLHLEYVYSAADVTKGEATGVFSTHTPLFESIRRYGEMILEDVSESVLPPKTGPVQYVRFKQVIRDLQ